MDSTVLMILVVLAIVVVAVAIWYEQRRRRSLVLRERFGAEYDRTVKTEGGIGRAESVLDARARRVEKLHIRPLEPSRPHALTTPGEGFRHSSWTTPKGR